MFGLLLSSFVLRDETRKYSHVHASFPGSFRELADQLTEAHEQFDKNAALLDNLLDTLDDEQHSIGVLFVLVSKLNTMPVSCHTSVELWPCRKL